MSLFLTPIRALVAVNGAVLAVGRLAATIALGLMTLLILAQVYFRYIDGNALAWSEEAARFLMLWMTGLIAPSAFRSGGFVAIDTINRFLPRRLGAVLSAALLVICLTVLLIGLQFALKHVKTGWLWKSSSLKYSFQWMQDLPTVLQPSEDLMTARPQKLKLAWMYMSLPVGIGLMISVSIELILRSVADMFGAGDRLPPLPVDRAQGAE